MLNSISCHREFIKCKQHLSRVLKYEAATPHTPCEALCWTDCGGGRSRVRFLARAASWRAGGMLIFLVAPSPFAGISAHTATLSFPPTETRRSVFPDWKEQECPWFAEQ